MELSQLKQELQAIERKSTAELRGLCSGAKFNLFNFSDVTSDGETVYYKGKKVKLEVADVIGEGAYGTITIYTFNVGDENFKMAYKNGKFDTELEELIIIKKHLNALTCDGLISMLEYKGGVLMPLANGDLLDFMGKLEFNQALEVAYRLGLQLKCLIDMGYNYYDIKPANTLYFCRKDGELDVTLGDIGSIIPDDDNQDYICTYPPPIFYQGFVPVVHDDSRTYTYLLLNMIFLLALGRGFTMFNSSPFKYTTAFQDHLSLIAKILADRGLPNAHPIAKMVDSLITEANSDELPPLDEFISSLRSYQYALTK